MTVGADEGEIAELGAALSRYVERKDVMALDVPGTAVPVDLLEVEAARLTSEMSATLKDRSDLLLAQALVPFARRCRRRSSRPSGALKSSPNSSSSVGAKDCNSPFAMP
ncbi:hypothetical protein [Streptomyces microflavus]|uniref:hypothetical protein n=1 Tax=Streptomyces microflavus TaxID=1919 RepID=UPI0037FEEBE5